jgi:hypothetical protein
LGLNVEQSEAAMGETSRTDRQTGVLMTAHEEGLLGARDRTIGGRVPRPLVDAAKARSGIRSDSELLLYALSKVAIEDDFGRKLVARKGRLPKDVNVGV